jgi:hypothetical protein
MFISWTEQLSGNLYYSSALDLGTSRFYYYLGAFSYPLAMIM